MFIIAGESESEKKLGVVADKCLICGQVTVLRVTQICRRPHIYLIPLGSAKPVATILTCNGCGGKATGGPHAFAQFLTEKQAKTMSVGEILEQTNPPLAKAIAYRAQLEIAVREGRGAAAGGPDPRLQLAFARLAEHDRG